MTEIRLAANYVDIASAFGNFDCIDSNRNHLIFCDLGSRLPRWVT